MKTQTKRSITHRRQSGFTLIELMITLAIGAIILTQAIPSFGDFIRSNRLISQTNDLVADINLARTEAISRSTRVILCNSANSRAAAASCDGAAQTWTTGWLLFADDDRSGAYEAANDTLIRIGQPAHDTIAILTDADASGDLQFNPDGTANEDDVAIFAICDGDGEANGRQINVNTVGRPRLLSAPIADCSP